MRFINEQYAEPKIFYDIYGFSFGIGIRYFLLSNFNIKNGTEKQKITEYKSIGPLAEISYEISDSMVFKTYGWYEFINTETNAKRQLANFNLKLMYRL